MFKLVLEKAEEPETKLPTSSGSSKKAREFQRTARRDKTFFNEQCKEVEENNRMGKTRDLFKIKRTLHARMGTIKDRKGKDLTEAEEIKRWQNMQKNYTKKILMTGLSMMVQLLTILVTRHPGV